MLKLFTLFVAIASLGLSPEKLVIVGSAPFCKVNRAGTMAQCYYYNMDACKRVVFNNEFCIWRAGI